MSTFSEKRHRGLIKYFLICMTQYVKHPVFMNFNEGLSVHALDQCPNMASYHCTCYATKSKKHI